VLRLLHDGGASPGIPAPLELTRGELTRVPGRATFLTVDSDELRAVQQPLKERYLADPGAALVTLVAEGDLGEGITCSVATGRAMVEAGLHPPARG
jgi:hypothetical protein